MSLESFLRANTEKIGFLRWLILPTLVAATFFFLDARYISKSDWSTQINSLNSTLIQVSTEQKQGFSELTRAVTALTNEQRNTAEFQRVYSSGLSNLTTRFDKHESLQDVKWGTDATFFSKIDERFDRIELANVKQDVSSGKNTETIYKLSDRIQAIENIVIRHDAIIQRNSEIINSHPIKSQ